MIAAGRWCSLAAMQAHDTTPAASSADVTRAIAGSEQAQRPGCAPRAKSLAQQGRTQLREDGEEHEPCADGPAEAVSHHAHILTQLGCALCLL